MTTIYFFSKFDRIKALYAVTFEYYQCVDVEEALCDEIVLGNARSAQPPQLANVARAQHIGGVAELVECVVLACVEYLGRVFDGVKVVGETLERDDKFMRETTFRDGNLKKECKSTQKRL